MEVAAVAPIEVRMENKMESEITPENKTAEETKPNELPTAEWKNPEGFAGSTFNATVLNIINTVIGAGILSIAYSIRQAGILGSVLMIILILVPSLITGYYCSASSIYTNEGVYGVIGTKLISPVIGILADFSVVLLDFGICCAYMNVLFNQFLDLLVDFTPLTEAVLEPHRWWISLVISLVILFPISSIKNMDALRFTSGIAVVCIAIFVISCIYLGIIGYPKHKTEYLLFPDSVDNLSTAFSVFILCFCCHLNIPKMTSEMKFSTKSKFPRKIKKITKALFVAYATCALSYLFVGICGYLAFGNAIKSSILDSLKDITFVFTPVIKIGYALVVMFSYPILAFPATYTLDSYMFKSERTLTRRLIIVFIWLILTFIVAIAIPDLAKIFGVTGSTCGVLIVFVWPALYYIYMVKNEKKKPVDLRSNWFHPTSASNVIAWIILIVGIILCIVATAQQIAQL